jgi:hypothetical protein
VKLPLLFGLLSTALAALAETNEASPSPAMGWSSWSFIRTLPTEASIEAQALALHNSGLQSHGFIYVNVDAFYTLDASTSVDAYGRWAVNSNYFPHGMSAVADFVHRLGLKFGVYVNPGIPLAAWNQNTPIAGTPYHARDIVSNTNSFEAGAGNMYYIDYTKSGAQEFINSWADLLASWGVDYVKLDFVGDWDVSDVAAWSAALNQTGRSIHFELSNALDVNNGGLWAQYANGWRIEGDIECYCSSSSGSYPLTSWNNVAQRFHDAPQWTQFSAPGAWNDLDSLELGNGTNNGLTLDQRRAAITLWAICRSTFILGADLTVLESDDLAMLCNDRVLQLNQNGTVAAPLVYDATNQVWRAAEPDGSYAIGLFNLGSSPTNMSVTWSQLGFVGGADVQDLWSGNDLGLNLTGCNSLVPADGAVLLRVAPSLAATRYLAVASANTLAGGAVVSEVPNASGGLKVGYIGMAGTLTFNNIVVPAPGTYTATFLYYNGDPSRVADISVNGGTASAMTFNTTGAWTNLGSQMVTISLAAGTNRITVSNPTAYAPDFDSVVVQSAAPSIPPSPHGLLATSGNAQVVLSWLATPGASGYQIKFGTASGVYTATNTSSIATCSNTGLSNGSVYHFVISATNSAGASKDSAEIAALCGPPLAPTGMTAQSGNAEVGLQWNPVPNATSYNVLRSSVPDGAFTFLANVFGTTYSDVSVTNETTYYYAVTALNGAAPSPNSPPVPATPSLPNGAYQIVCLQSGLALDAPNGGTGVDQQPPNGVNQQWTLTSLGNGGYRIVAANGVALTGSSISSQLTLQPYTGAANQVWTFQAVNSFGYGLYCIIKNTGTGQVMDDFGNSTSPGNAIGQWVANGGNNQLWSFRALALTQVVLMAFINGSNINIGFNSTSSGVYVLESSPDLSNWTPIYTNTPDTQGVFLYSEPLNAVVARFYRVVQ